MIKYILKNAVLDYKNSYKASFLSYSWAVIHPLLLLLVYTFVFSKIMQARVDTSGSISYTLFLAVLILPWIVFSTSILQGTLSIINNVNFIKKIDIPLYVYVVKEVLEQFFNMIIVVVILFIFLYLNGVPLSFRWLLILIPLTLLFVFSLGISMFLSAINIFFRDIEKAIGVFLQIMMWALPIVYPWDIVPIDWQWVIFYDPLFYYFNSIREVLLYGNLISYKYILIMTSTSFLVYLIGYFTLKRLESDIRDSI